ncbi:MAG: phosphate regulon sensor histidine kinase PhoR [Halioglobus sp.]|nr:phosphate regulon sensor histidine kinase PhoR [Halioglobus sp.]
MSWLSAAIRIGLLVAVAGLVGWYYGHPLRAVAATLLGLVLFWMYQMQRVQAWLRSPGRPPPATYGFWGDIISEIYQLQKQGRESSAQLQSTVDYLQASFSCMRDGVVIVDQRGVLKWFNQSAQSLLGLRSTDTGQSLMNLVRSPEFLRYFNRGEFGGSLEYRAAGEADTWLRVEITPFGAGDRLLFVRDITANVRMETMRKDFVANVSHELRTPLTVISGYLGTILGDSSKLAPSHVKPLQQMLQQSQRMETLLEDLLWLSRIESEQGMELHSPVDVGALLAELQDELAVAYPQRRLELELATDYKVAGDYRELYSAVSNLVLNAIKYSAEDSVVKITWRQQDGAYHLTVSDQGIGIEAVHIPRLTERFYRVEDSRCSATGGTGLGLAIVKHVAASHGARLQISSKVGKGSSFSLVFPNPGRGTAAAQVSAVAT